MIGKIVITSVPQGLGGGSGFQPVLRTAGLRPSIAERLAMRASYPHPYEFGNPANPHVLFHRIETVGDRTIHILGSVRDAGSSYTGRSNYLAELIAIDPSEKRSLPAGPAFVARAFPWLHQWLGEPHEIPLGQEPAIPAEDPEEAEGTGSPRVCTKWASLSGDAGWAGELARSFVEGRFAVIWVEKNDDVPALFVEAARLLPPSERWRLTFNTCEIEPFPAHWRALRADLPVVGPRPSAKDLVLDLAMLRKTGQRAPENALVLLARGAPPKKPTTTTQLPTDAGNRHAYPVEVALRAHLKEISDERKRRSKASPQANDAASRWSVWQTIAATTIGGMILTALLVTVIAVRAALKPGAASRWFDTSFRKPEAASLATDLRSGMQQAEQEERQRIQHAQQSADEQAADDHKKAEEAAEADRKKIADLRREEQKQKSEQLNKHLEAERRRVGQQRLGRQRLAIEQLKEQGGNTVVSLERTARSPPSVDLFRFQQCGFLDLIEPSIDIAHPYGNEERITVVNDPQQLGKTAWLVKGSFLNRHVGSYEGPIAICRIQGEDNTFRLEPLLPDGHALLRRLENTVLLVSCRDPDAAVAKVRRVIGLSKPLDATQHHIDLDPLGGDPPGNPVSTNLPDGIMKRLESVDANSVDWSIQLTHPALNHPVVLDKGHTKTTVVLAKPPENGIAITYHRPVEDGTHEQRSVLLRLDVAIEICNASRREAHLEQEEFSLDGATVHATPHLEFIGERDTDRFVLRNALTEARIASLQRQAGTESDDQTIRSIEVALDNQLHKQRDPYHDSLEQKIHALQQAQASIPAPGSTGNPGITPENTSAYAARIREIQDTLRKLLREKKKYEDSTKKLYENDAKLTAVILQRHRDWLGPLTIRVSKCVVIARDTNDLQFAVPIVAEEPN